MSLSRLKLFASLVIVLVCILLGYCRYGSAGPPPAPHPAPPIQPPAVTLPPVVVPPPPIIVAPPAPEPPPAAVVEPDPAPEIPPAPAPEPAPAAAPEPVATPAVPPPAPPADAARREAIRAELVKQGYRYGGKAAGPWPPHLLDEEIKRRLQAASAPAK